MRRSKKSGGQAGMLTVEATLIFPIIILTVFGVLYLSVLLYQNTVATAEATRAADRAAAYWRYLAVDDPPSLTAGTPASALIDKFSYTARSPYRFITETAAGLGGRRLDNARRYAKACVAGVAFSAYADSAGEQVDVSVRYGFLSSYLDVTVKKRYLNPLGSLMARLGIGPSQQYESTASAVITNPTEFIRNVDLLWEIGGQ